MNVVEYYFSPDEGGFWRWQDDGNVVAWSDGSTIAFRAELLAVYRRLSTSALPPFGAVLLLMAACRESWRESPKKFDTLHRRLLKFVTSKEREEFLDRVAAGLDRVCALPEKLRAYTGAKAELAAMVFEDQRETPPPRAYERLIAELEQGIGERPETQRTARIDVDRLLRDLNWLHRGLHRVDAEALAARLQTGLEQPLEPADVELPTAAGARRLLAELQDDEELGGIARLAKQLLPTVHLPTPLSYPDDLPVGGVSDISNRGSLDRLLLSELAHEDLTLAVRVAMNEALYLRREVPPTPPPRRRIVLLDSGLRMWGVPRVYAAAVGLAFAADARDDTAIDVLRPAGGELCDVDFASSVGIASHLEVLDHRLHPGEALPALTERMEELHENTDVVIVTGADVYSDHEFRRLLTEQAWPEVHVATVDRDGRFELHLQTPRGAKPLRQAQFALDDILQPPQKPTTSLVSSYEVRPTIFCEPSFPLLLSHPKDAERSWHVQDFGALTYARDGRLLHWADAEHGARQIAEGLPPGALHWAGSRAENGMIPAVIGKLSGKGLYAVQIYTSGSCRWSRLQIDMPQPKFAFVHHLTVFAADGTHLIACGLTSGQTLARLSTAELRHEGGRFFSNSHERGTRVWKAASFNGSQVVLTDFYTESLERTRLLGVFETVNHEGPYGIRRDGSLWNFGTNQARRVRQLETYPPTMVRGASRNGKRLVLATTPHPPRGDVLLDVGTLVTEGIPAGRSLPEALEMELFRTIKPVTLRHRFQGVGVDTQDRLTLIGRRDSCWPLTYDRRDGTIRLPSQPVAVQLKTRAAFETLDQSRENRYGLAVAKFGETGRAILDERGLLHLQSTDSSVPEMTLVLVEGAIAGWVAGVGLWGPDYFTGESPALSERRAKRDHLQAFVQRIV